jgi:hypothetical protein
MYQVYIIDESAFDSKKLIGEFKDYEKASEKIANVLAKNKDIKYILEETTVKPPIFGPKLKLVFGNFLAA